MASIYISNLTPNGADAANDIGNAAGATTKEKLVDILDESTPGRTLVEAEDVAAQRTALGLGTAALAGDASESAKGIVQLGATGVPSATKVPKALGADLVALITAAGYTLSPAEGTASLDGIADGTTYKRILAAIATALNAGTFDAPKCTAFGIGSIAKNLGDGADISGMLNDGIFSVYNPSNAGTGLPAIRYWIIFNLQFYATTIGYGVQIAFDVNSYDIYYRQRGMVSTPWNTWVKIYNASTDGNGGQPPSAKSNQVSNATIGWFDAVDCASGASVTLPAGGTFEWFVTTYGATYNSVTKGISAGGAMTGTASANLRMYYKRLTA